MFLTPLLQVTLNLGEISPEFGGSLLSGTFKFFFLIAALLYVAFAFIVIRQIKVMQSTLITSFSPVLTLLGYLHFALAVGVFLIFFVIL